MDNQNNTSPTATLKNKTILLIDDAPGILLMARSILENDFATVFTAISAAEGIELAKKTLPQLIITDLIMPFESGFDFLERCKATPKIRDIPIIVLSGQHDKDSVYKAIALGAKDYVIKPFQSALLLNKVKRALGQRTFSAFVFDTNDRHKISFSITARVMKTNDSSFLIETPVRLTAGNEIQLTGPVGDHPFMSGLLMRTYQPSGQYAQPGLYHSNVMVLELDENKDKS